jgi:ferric-dicitrate binding protein FerR (iron transport regulator)
MSEPHLSRLATELLREEERLEASSAADDMRAIDAIERAIAAGRRGQRIRRIATATSLAAAAAALLVVGWRVLSHRAPDADAASTPTTASAQLAALGHPLSDGVVIVRDGRERSITSGTALAPPDHVVTTATGRLAVSLPTGTHLVVGTSSDFAFTEQGLTFAFALGAGTVHADVARLRAGERFLVRTPDGEIEVRGTSFDVRVVDPSPTCGAGTRTRVTVSEGTVVVRAAGREDSLHKGESWPRECVATGASEPPATQPSTPAAAPSAEVTARAQPSRSNEPPATVLAAPSPPGSDLAAQNALFAQASTARRNGDRATALATYDRFLEQYPGSQLAESAYVERMRLLAASDPRRGAAAARAYLARYPRGFASAEATDLTASGR